MVELIPDMLSPDIKSDAEKNLFHNFREYTGAGNYIILHSLGVSEHVNNIFGEIDFVIICSQGVLCVEVKGGAVSCQNGIWGFTNRYGKQDTRAYGPFQQAQGNMHSLREYLRKRLGDNYPFVTCQYACCVVMPDCCFDYRGIEIIPGILFDRNSYAGLDELVNTSFDFWIALLESKHGFHGTALTNAEMKMLAGILRGDFRFVPSTKDTIDRTAKALLELTDEQYDLLESLSDNPRTVVAGVAGSGKTLLAMEQARRLFWSGHSVLYLCFNRNLASFVKYRLKKEGVDIVACSFHALLSEETASTGSGSDFFENELPLEFLKKKEPHQYDYMIVDEGQDLLKPNYLRCMDRLAKRGIQEGSWIFFYDQNQNIYNTDARVNDSLSELLKHAVSFRLTVNCRNTRQITNANTLMSGIRNIGRPKINGPNVSYIPYDDPADKWNILDNLLRTLKNDEVIGSDLIILSKYAAYNPDCCIFGHQAIPDAGTLKTTGDMWRAGKNDIRFSTISAFKGLESKIVILVDVDDFSSERAKMLNYGAISRATSLLYVIYDRKKEDERQEMIVRSFSGVY